MSAVDLAPCGYCAGPLIDGSSFWLDPTGEGIHTGCEEQRQYEEQRQNEEAVAATLGSRRSRHTGHEHGRPLHSV